MIFMGKWYTNGLFNLVFFLIFNDLHSYILLFYMHRHFWMTRSTFTKLVSMFRQDAQMDVSYTGGLELLSIEKKK